MSRSLPEGYRTYQGEGLVYVARPEERHALQAMGLDRLETVRLRLAGGRTAGRGRIGEAQPPAGASGPALILKQVFHGGLPGRINRRGYGGPGRVLSELDLTVRSRQRGVPVPGIPWAAWTRGWPCELFLATVKVAGARNLAEIAGSEPAGPGRAALRDAAARAVARMHDAGLWHKDLNIRNIIVAGAAGRGGGGDGAGDGAGEPEAMVLDLGGSRLRARLSDFRRASNLARLLRSLHKSGLAGKIGRRERVAFLRTYAGEDGARYRDLRARIQRLARWHGLHQLTWR